LYHLLENEIAPNFYHRVDGAVPTGWVEMMKRSISKLAPRFSTSRMVQAYATKFYMTASDCYRKLSSNNLENAKSALEWRDRLKEAWTRVQVVSVDATNESINPVGKEVDVRAKVDLGGLDPKDVLVQALVGQVDSNRELQGVTTYDLQNTGKEDQLWIYTGSFKCNIPGHRGFTIRIVPRNELLNVASELRLVKWEN